MKRTVDLINLGDLIIMQHKGYKEISVEGNELIVDGEYYGEMLGLSIWDNESLIEHLKLKENETLSIDKLIEEIENSKEYEKLDIYVQINENVSIFRDGYLELLKLESDGYVNAWYSREEGCVVFDCKVIENDLLMENIYFENDKEYKIKYLINRFQNDWNVSNSARIELH